MRWPILVLVVCACIAGTVFSNKEHEKKDSFKSKLAQAAKLRFEKRLKEIDEKQAQDLKAARETFISELDAAMTAATQAAELDEAIRIRDAKNAVDAELKENAKTPQIPRAAVTHGRSMYLVIHRPNTSWQEARAICRQMGGDLAVIDDRTELQFLQTQVQTTNNWVGASLVGNVWRWIDGTAVDGSFWYRGGPSNQAGFDVAYMLSGDASIWNQSPRHNGITGFVCEWRKR